MSLGLSDYVKWPAAPWWAVGACFPDPCLPGACLLAAAISSSSTQASTWYALTVEDRVGRRAYSDPIWVDVVAYPATKGAAQ